MSVTSEINILKGNIRNAYTSIQNKGGTIPSNKNTENLSSAIETIPSSGGDIDWNDYYTTPISYGSSGIAGSAPFGSLGASIKKIPSSLSYNTGYYLFYGSVNLEDASALYNKVINIQTNYMFGYCKKLTAIPYFDTSKVTEMPNMFSSCSSLTTIPSLDTSNVTNMSNMFSSCSSLTTIPSLDTSNVTNMSNMFSSCSSLTTIPSLDTSNVTNMSYMFRYCSSLTTIPSLDTSNVTNVGNMFYDCRNLETVPSLNLKNCTYINYLFYGTVPNVTTLGGFQNLGEAYLTTKSANYSNYKLDLSKQTKLTEQSLINVLNNLYDIATKGCKAQQVVLGSTNLAKLTSEEGQQALTNAQTKGWTVS